MSKCVICFNEHYNQSFDGNPSMYCDTCWPIRDSVRGQNNFVIGSIYLGDMVSAAKFEGDRLCVHEMVPYYVGQFHHIPILAKKPKSTTDRTGAVVSMPQLEAACDLIQKYYVANKPLLVHCHGGIERSPLTLAWWLFTKTSHVYNLDEAYAYLKLARPAISPRFFWLPKDSVYYREIP